MELQNVVKLVTLQIMVDTYIITHVDILVQTNIGLTLLTVPVHHVTDLVILVDHLQQIVLLVHLVPSYITMNVKQLVLMDLGQMQQLVLVTLVTILAIIVLVEVPLIVQAVNLQNTYILIQMTLQIANVNQFAHTDTMEILLIQEHAEHVLNKDVLTVIP